MPAKCNDPTEYVATLELMLRSCGRLEALTDHYTKQTAAAERDRVLLLLYRCGAFLHEVVCAFVVQDLDALTQRHMRKAAVGLVRGTD